MTDGPAIIDPIRTLLDRARREVDEGLLPSCQVAVAMNGELVVDATFGADDATRYIPFSATKVLTAAAMWRLIGDQGLDVEATVASIVPAFGTNSKDVVTIEQVMVHTSGFPMVMLGPDNWKTRAERLAAFETWGLEYEPGTKFAYHATSAHWVLCEIIETITGEPYVDAIHHLVTEPLGLPRLLGIPRDAQDGIAEVTGVGDPATDDELRAEFGQSAVDAAHAIPIALATAFLCALNHPQAREQGVPGGGGVMRAADMTMLYQALLDNPDGLWDPAVLADGTGHIRNRLPDASGIPANRSLGLIIAGDDGFATRHGFGAAASPRAFGHDGAGGQIAFADPETGVSVCYVTNGLDQNLVRQHHRDVEIADAMCAIARAPIND